MFTYTIFSAHLPRYVVVCNYIGKYVGVIHKRRHPLMGMVICQKVTLLHKPI